MRRALIALLLLFACTPETVRHEKLIDIGEFELVDHEGRVFRSSSLRGRPALLFFGYTHCPDFCPTTMAKVARAYREAGPETRGIPTLFVSLDPRDTPRALKEYLSYFRAVPATGLTGSRAQIDAVVKQFGARYDIHENGAVDHTVRLYLLDAEGDVVRLFDPAAEAEEIARAMLALQ